MDQQAKEQLIRAVASTIFDHADQLTALDQAIGDGDHGINLKRGFEAVVADLPGLAIKPWPDLLKAVGMTMVMKVGGASGPLFGTFFMEFGKALGSDPDRTGVAAAFARAVEAVKARGRSEAGQKTLLDVLVPFQAALATDASADTLAEEARMAAESTVPLKAIRGRASFLGERSIGHMDPGARSASLIIAVVMDALKTQGMLQ